MAEHIVGGRYRLIAVLGKAARITTYDAETTDTRERVVIRGFPAADDDVAKAAQQEAEARAKLAHPALPKVREHFVDRLNGVRGQFVVEERAAGAETATALVAKRGPRGETEVAAIARALLGALDHLHERGFTHPSVSPDQVLVAPDGRAVLVDWGDPPGQAARAPSAPEIARGEPATQATDLHALGTTLAFLLAGTEVEPARALETLRPRAPKLGPWVAQLVADAPAHRFGTPRVALAALDDATREPFWRTQPPWVLGVAAAVPVLVLLTAGAAMLHASSAAADRAEAAANAREQERATRRDELARLQQTSIGCADGTREAFKDLLDYPRIAGCSGAFKVPGLLDDVWPSCGRAAGNDGQNLLGAGCNAGDLCANGFHVCRSSAEVRELSSNGCAGANDAPPATFFATRQSGPGCNECATGSDPNCDENACHAGCAAGPAMADDLFGCGNVGTPAKASCAPLNRSSGNLCGTIGSAWHCRGGNTVTEARVVTKPETTGGGVLCCAD